MFDCRNSLLWWQLRENQEINIAMQPSFQGGFKVNYPKLQNQANARVPFPDKM